MIGPLDLGILRQSIQVLNDRHEILRTTFAEKDDELVQVISGLRPAPFSVSIVDGLPESDLENQVRFEARGPFDLANGPLWRARLFRVAANDHVLVVTLHHAIADGWSQNIFQRELWLLYDALRKHQLPQLPSLEIQYGDFTVWQKEWLASEKAQDDLAFWKRQLRSPLPILDISTDASARIHSYSDNEIATLLLPHDLVLGAKKLSQAESTTSFALYFSCFAALLYCCSGQTDILAGAPSANRRAETEPLIGPFAGPIALRLDLSCNPTLAEVLRRARDMITDALNHAEIPFSVLLDELKVRSIRGRNPLFQFYFLYQTAFLQPHKVGDLTVTPMPTFGIGTPFELQFALIEREEGVRGQLEYNTDSLDAKGAKELLERYRTILQRFVSAPTSRIEDLERTYLRADKVHQPADHKPNIEYVAPRNDDELKLTQIWERLFDKSPIGVLENFFDLGGYSLLAARLAAQVKNQLGITFDLSVLMVAPTIADLALRLRSALPKDASHLVPLRTSGAKPPLFCVHGGGGHVLAYREMVNALPEDQPVYGFRALDGDDVHATVEQLAAIYLRDIRQAQKHGPYQLCGMSFGGLVAYEMATTLSAQGEEVGIVALLDTGNPAYYRDLPFQSKIKFQFTYLLDRLAKYGKRIFRGEFIQLALDAYVFIRRQVQTVVWLLLRKLGSTTKLSAQRYMQDAVVFGAVARSYTPKRYEGRVVLFRAQGRTAEYGSNIKLGWDEVVDDVQVRVIPGSHLSIMQMPNVLTLAEELNKYLAGIDTAL